MRAFLTIGFLLVLWGCASSEKLYPARSGDIVIMTYNVENLFDTQHDEGKDDWEYRPRADKDDPAHIAFCQTVKVENWRKSCLNKNWDDDVLARKMERLKEVILQMRDGRGPDILLLQEVENKRVLEKLRTEYLQEANYQPSILIEGPDPRGIDTALLTRLPLEGEPKLHTQKFVAEDGMTDEQKANPNKRGTRGILEATLKLPDDTLLTVLVSHFPSQGAPTPFRRQAIRKLNAVKESLPEDRLVIAGGDFNISRKEDAKNELVKTELEPHWLVSHKIGCKTCRGTHYYHRETSWSFLDMLLFDKTLLPDENTPGQVGWRVLPESIQIPLGSKHQVSRYNSPARFGSGMGAEGVSDHWPLTAVLRKRGEELSQ